MVQIRGTIWCDGCGVEITTQSVVANQSHYCCEDCSRGFECRCAAVAELQEPDRDTIHTWRKPQELLE